MSDSIIKVEGLGKKFIISHKQTGTYTALRDVISSKAKNLVKKKNDLPAREEFWALKDINFEIKQGEAVGVIGRNGAGKSTLLKILSRITEPTLGRIELNGRIASLLEVGTGFHPELTGRENVFLNGAILGMSRIEIRRKFDEIVEFAGVEKFLDTPVKRYSSGMYVRLAFSVAAHLEPEVLVVDEVLSVGDAEFQSKCLGKMNEVTKEEGRTVLFVSHNMGAIVQLCNKSVLLNNGTIQFVGAVKDSIDLYQNTKPLNTKINFIPKTSEGNYFEFIGMEGMNKHEKNEFGFDENITLILKMKFNDWHQSLELSTSIYNRTKNRVFTFDVALNKYYKADGIINLKITIPHNFLVPGSYSWLICINHNNVRCYDVQDDISQFNILETGSMFTKYAGADYGSVYPPDCNVEAF